MNVPLYRQIYLDLKHKIFDGTYQPDEKLPSENDLSKLYDVSRITAKRALTELEADGYCYRIQGRGSFVRPKATLPSDEVSNVVLLILPFGRDLSSGDYTFEMQPIMKEAGLELFVTTPDFFEDKTGEDIVQKYRGLIYYPQDSTHYLDILYELSMQQFPIVLLDKIIQDFEIPAIISDNTLGGYSATEHLLSLGHERIGFVYNGNERLSQPIRQRYFGYLEALAEAESDYRTPLHQAGHLLEDVIEVIKSDQITGMVCENDITAIKLIQALEEENISVPEDFSVVGFDDIQMASLLTPTLTTVAQDFKEIGRLASLTLLEKIKNPETMPSPAMVKTRLVVRDSTAKKP